MRWGMTVNVVFSELWYGSCQEGGMFMPRKTEYKSSVFSMLLEDPENALEVYNALNDSDYKDPSLVEMNRLEMGVLLTVRNDASFMIDDYINVYEHQSTFNPNMPLRSLIYYLEIVKKYFKFRDLYSRRLIKLPTPHFVVFYNGNENRPEKEVLRLSDAFMHPTDTPELEVVCTVYNINKGKNNAFLSKCKVLREYMIFVDKIRGKLGEGQSIDEAIDQAINECIEENVLKDFLIERGDEVRQVAALDYTWEAREGMIRKEEYEEGYKAGEIEGEKRGEIRGEKRGEIRGEIRGEKRGRKESKMDDVFICLEKFAPLPDSLICEISAASDESILSEIIRLAVGSDSLEEFKAELGKLLK